MSLLFLAQIRHGAVDTRMVCMMVGASEHHWGCCRVTVLCPMPFLNDRHFPPVTYGELKDIVIEISILTPPQAVTGIDEMQMGRDDIIINKNGKGALFLPQIAEEQGWTKEQWLTQLSLKAGLTADALKSGTKFLTFQAIVFEEEHRVTDR